MNKSEPILEEFYVTDEKGKDRYISADYTTTSTSVGSPGSYGQVYVCIRKCDGENCAVKVIGKQKWILKRSHRSHFKNFLAEIETLQKLQHPNIVKLYDVYETPSELMLVMELCEGGELYDRIYERYKIRLGYNERLASVILKQIFRALQFMHANNICHGDLKPSNILFSSTGETARIKVIDFGHSRMVPKWKRFLKKRCGTLFYMSPEILDGCYTKEADLWAVGIIMFQMLIGYTPFQQVGDERLTVRAENIAISKRIKRGFLGIPRGKSISAEAEKLMKHLIETEISKRYTADEALMHPWFESASCNHHIPESVLQQLKNVSTMCQFKSLVTGAFQKDADLTITMQVKKYFDTFDRNHDQRISLDEFREGICQYLPEIKKTEIKEIFNNLDIDGDSYIQCDEFWSLIAYNHLESTYERLRIVFSRLDKNQNGLLDYDDIPRLEEEINNDSLLSRLQINPSELIESADLDNDGGVSFDEFLFALHPELVEPKKRDSLKTLSEISKNGRAKTYLRVSPEQQEFPRMDSFDVALNNLLSPAKPVRGDKKEEK